MGEFNYILQFLETEMFLTSAPVVMGEAVELPPCVERACSVVRLDEVLAKI